MADGHAALGGLVLIRPLQRAVETLWRPSSFKAPWVRTVNLLSDELRYHGAEHPVLEVDYRPEDLRQDGLPRADRRMRSPAIALSFRATRVPGKPELRYEVGTYADWTDNVRAVALGLNALRAVDRYGVTRRGEQYAGWKALPAGAVGEGDRDRGRELIAAAGGNWKRAAALSHPDVNPDALPDDFRDVIAARDADNSLSVR